MQGWRAPPPRPDRRQLGAIAAGGFLGALARGALVQVAGTRAGHWPWVTFAVNLLAALLVGYAITRLQERLPPSLHARAFLGTGLCGALSTFSTMMAELLTMVRAGDWGLAAGYAVASIAGGLAAVFLATKLVRRAWLRA